MPLSICQTGQKVIVNQQHWHSHKSDVTWHPIPQGKTYMYKILISCIVVKRHGNINAQLQNTDIVRDKLFQDTIKNMKYPGSNLQHNTP